MLTGNGGPSTQASGFSPMQSRGKTISDFLDQGGRDDMDSKVDRFLYVYGIPFNILRSPYWHEMVEGIEVPLQDTGALGTPKLEP